MQLKNGERLGPYEIVSPLGTGGMGEVYRARDTRLGRDVAIKILALRVSLDPKVRVRFEREAKAVSALNHPNICALYDIGELPGGEEATPLQYIVMEYLEGQTLDELLKRGPLPLDDVFRYGLEIADALDKAHRKRILHRDLKPSNIMITPRGARLFDFGLAKFLRRISFVQWGVASSAASPAVTPRFLSEATTPEKPLTADGAMIGTLEYMAPEQLQGKEPDVRTDVFSFGVCLYQMVSGKRPFQGNTHASLIASILEKDPTPLSTHRPSVPPSLEWLVKNCLAKDPDERIQTAHDVMLELQRIRDDVRQPIASEPSAAQSRRRLYWSLTGIGIAVAVLAAVIGLQRTRITPSDHAIRRFSISLPVTAPLAEGSFEKLAVSPNGTRIAYVADRDPTRLYLYSVDTQETRLLPETERARGPFFSPDGQWVGFYTADGELKKVPVERGMPAVLSSDRNLRGASWGPDDTIVFAEPRSPLRRISAAGGKSEVLFPYDPHINMRWPWFLPGGESILCTVSDFSGDYETAKLAVRSLRTGTTTTIVNGATYGRYSGTGHLVYLHSQTLFAVPFDRAALKTIGSAVPLLSDVDVYGASGVAQFAISSDGSLFYVPRDRRESEGELVWVDRSGQASPVVATRQAYEDPKLSPDQKQILVTIGPSPHEDLWLYDRNRDAWTRLTSQPSSITGVWAPDGRQIAFASNLHGGFDLYVISSDGSAPPKQITRSRSWDFPTSWSPDGKSVAVVEQYRGTLADIFVVPADGRTAPAPFLATPFNEHAAVFSPDGHWIAYQSNESGRDEVYVKRYPRGAGKWVVSTGGGRSPVWRRDGRELFYRSDNRTMSVETQLGAEFSARKPRMLFKGDFNDNYDVTPDGQRFIMVKRPPQARLTQINVVLGAFDHLK